MQAIPAPRLPRPPRPSFGAPHSEESNSCWPSPTNSLRCTSPPLLASVEWVANYVSFLVCFLAIALCMDKIFIESVYFAPMLFILFHKNKRTQTFQNHIPKGYLNIIPKFKQDNLTPSPTWTSPQRPHIYRGNSLSGYRYIAPRHNWTLAYLQAWNFLLVFYWRYSFLSSNFAFQ